MAKKVELKPINLQTIELDIIGVTELICHNWSEKTKRQMLDRQMGKANVTKEPKDPEADYQSSFYRMPDGSPGFPAAAFKAAIVGACRQLGDKNLPMTKVKVAVRVNGELVPIYGEPYMRQDMVKLETGVPDIRFRAAFPKWETRLSITYNANVLSAEMLVNLTNLAGMGGVGEWRPSAPKSATGSFGCFRVKGTLE
mgnify:CR=1 FL=1